MYPPVLTSCGQDEFKFGISTPRSAGRSTPRLASSGQIWQIYPRSASRCTPQYLHPVVKMSSNLADLPLDLLADLPPGLTSCGQDEFKFGRSTPRSAGRSIPSLASSGQIWQIYPRSASRCTPLLTSSGKEWQFQVSIVTAHISRSTGRSIPSTDILWSRWPFHF